VIAVKPQEPVAGKNTCTLAVRGSLKGRCPAADPAPAAG
jgi:hypothetical protein